jgi:Leucine-rich repeat (LRR) protein
MNVLKIFSLFVVSSGALCAESVGFDEISKLVDKFDDEKAAKIIECDLSGKLNIENFFGVCDVLIKCENLKSLDLSNNGIGSFSKDNLKAICAYLPKFKKLEKMNLNQNSLHLFGIEGLQIFTEALNKSPSVKIVRTEGSNFNDEAKLMMDDAWFEEDSKDVWVEKLCCF